MNNKTDNTTPNKKYKVAVLGPIPKDHITTHKDEVIEKYGGINNPAIALAKLFAERATIYPVSHVRQQDLPHIQEILRVYPNIDLSYLSAEADQGDIIRLRFIDQNKRLEKQAGVMNPIVPEDVKNLLDCDIFVFVPITDFEIALSTLKFIKKYSKGLILFDAHGPTNVLTALGDRLIKFWVDRDLWLPYIDVLKMNMEEAKGSWFRPQYTLSELENDYSLDLSELKPFAEHCFDKGVRALSITLDDKGCMVYYRSKGQTQEVHVHGVKVSNVVDTTGCGDSFAAGFAYGLLTTGDYIKSAQYANALGAQRTQGRTFDVFKSLAETDKMLAENYG